MSEPVLNEQDLDFFRKNGYVVARNVVPEPNRRAVIDAVFDFLGMDPDDPTDWYRPPLALGGMIEMYQHQALWDNRQNPKVYQAFCDIYGTEKLWVSIDRANFKPPRHPDHPEYEHKGFTHW
jgi:hypothetical protein